MTLNNATGITTTFGSVVMMTPRLDPTSSGSGTSADPGIYSYSFEFTEAEVTSMNLPDFSSGKQLTCYLNAALIPINDIDPSLDVTTYAPFSPIIAQLQTDDDNSGGDNTSGAINMIGNKATLALLTLLGFMTIS